MVAAAAEEEEEGGEVEWLGEIAGASGWVPVVSMLILIP